MAIQRNLSSWVDGDPKREGVRRTIAEMDTRMRRFEQLLSAKLRMGVNGNGGGLSEALRGEILALVAGRVSTVIGLEATDPLAVGLPTNNGTVTSITFNSAFTGGTITSAGSVTLVIGSANVIQKSDGAKLVNSLIGDNGTLITFGTVATFDIPNGLFILDIGTLPALDPGVPGALWNNAGVINVSP